MRRGVVAVVFRNDRLLAIRRSAFVAAPGMVCFPGGGVEADESEPEALIREICEELNVCIMPQRRIWSSITSWNVQLSWWTAEMPQHECPRPNPSEVADVYWQTLEELESHKDLLSSNRKFLEFVRQQGGLHAIASNH